MLEFIYNKITGLFQSSNINIKVCRVKGMMRYYFFYFPCCFQALRMIVDFQGGLKSKCTGRFST